MSKFKPGILFHFFVFTTIFWGQSFDPAILSVGAGATTLTISNGGAVRAGLSALWNGSARPSDSSSSQIKISLTASDVAKPGLNQITLIDTQTGAAAAQYTVSVGYNVRAESAVWDSIRKRAYIACAPDSTNADFPANSIVAFDPESGVIGPAYREGNTLGDMALSDDGSALYVVVEGSNIVRRVDPAKMTAVSSFAYRTGSGRDTTFQGAITVMPGKPGTVGFYYRQDPGSSGAMLAIFDNGIKRAAELPAFDGLTGPMFSPDGKYLFIGSPLTAFTLGGLFRYSVSDAGFAKQDPKTTNGGTPAAIVGSTIYTVTGAAVDIETLDPVATYGLSGCTAIDAANDRVLVMGSAGGIFDNQALKLQAFSLSTTDPLGSISAGSGGTPVIFVQRFPQKLIRFGTDGVIYTGNTHVLVFHTPLAGPAPATSAAAIVSAASSKAGGSISPGEIVSIFGTNLGPRDPATFALVSGTIPAALASVQVWFGATQGRVLLAYSGQLNVIAPFGLQPGSSVPVQVWYYGIPSKKVFMPVVAAGPALFTRDGTGAGNVAVINQDGSVNAASPPGSVVTLYGTGGGLSDGAVDGGVPRSAKSLQASAQVLIDGKNATVFYAGVAPFLPYGAFQLNVQVPADVSPGTKSIQVRIAGQQSPGGATLEVR